MNHRIMLHLKNVAWLVPQVILYTLLTHSSYGAQEVRDEHTEDDHVELSDSEIKEFGIIIEKATSGIIEETITLPGEVIIDPGRLTHIVPRVSGVARDVYKQLGDTVGAGELLATLSSRELAEIRAELHAAQSRYQLAQATYERESKLKKEGITSEQEFLTAQQARDSARVELNLARQKLEAIGITGNAESSCQENCDPTIFEMRSPAEGIIVEKHIVPGELLDNSDRPFVIANLDQVWINLTVYQEFLDDVRAGQKVRIVTDSDSTATEAIIDYISPIVSEATRSATARVIVNNGNAVLHPGLFVSGIVTVSDMSARIVIPRTALQTIDNKTVVFIKNGNEFEPRTVKLGRGNSEYIEVLEGLNENEEFAAVNGFILKAEMQKSAFGDAHGH